jgi:hypothetical protein
MVPTIPAFERPVEEDTVQRENVIDLVYLEISSDVGIDAALTEFGKHSRNIRSNSRERPCCNSYNFIYTQLV